MIECNVKMPVFLGVFCLSILLVSNVFSESIIKDVKSNDGREHAVQEGLDDDVPLFVDRVFTAMQVPDMFKGATYIQTAYDCKLEPELELTFTVTSWCHIYVCPRQGVVELDWLKEDYDLLHETIMYKRAGGDRVMDIWKSRKLYAPGNTVTTYETNSNDTFYFVFAVKAAAAVEYPGKLSTIWGYIKSAN